VLVAVPKSVKLPPLTERWMMTVCPDVQLEFDELMAPLSVICLPKFALLLDVSSVIVLVDCAELLVAEPLALRDAVALVVAVALEVALEVAPDDALEVAAAPQVIVAVPVGSLAPESSSVWSIHAEMFVVPWSPERSANTNVPFASVPVVDSMCF
jgi:hypothetical protein